MHKGGDVVQENITANVAQDVVTLEFQRNDGTLITQLIDFSREVQILKALVLGEEERGQSQYQVMCFVTHISKEEFISSDAISKLRQKNPGTIRQAEEDKGRFNISLDFFLSASSPSAAKISPHIAAMCSEAAESTYTRMIDVHVWASLLGISPTKLLSNTKKFPIKARPPCTENANLWSPCTCRLELCIDWYPCGLKYCKGKDVDAGSSSYRCGIKTCRKCHLFSYYVKQKMLCLWDE
ncbi:hypothetical protein M8J76_012284 [Diaphorina citri]|nr:hypothetical protein M8J76_012284 [Diaphorina citri]